MKRLSLLLPLMFLLLASCGRFLTPDPIQRPVSPSDVIGRYKYHSSTAGLVELHLHNDGTFLQIFHVPVRRTYSNSGDWTIRGSEIEFKNFCFLEGNPSQEKPIRDTITWTLVESPVAGEVALYGGDGDPDHDEILVRGRIDH